MSWAKNVLQDLHERLSPPQFEKLIYALLDKMGFSDLELTGRSGDGGIDLTATWTQSQVPGLEIDLDFIIQVKRLKPEMNLNPMVLRALKGSMTSGQWGLLVTTGRVSARTREEGVKDPSRIVSVIDGSQLIDLCAQYEIGVKREYHFDDSFLKPTRGVEERPEIPPPRAYPRDLSKILTIAVGETFDQVGRTSIYKSDSKTVLARWSQRYKYEAANYWYGLRSRDLASIQKYGITHFAYVCSDYGVVLLPVKIALEYVEAGTMRRTPKEGPLLHYHIVFVDEKGELRLVLRNGVTENVEKFFYRVKK